MAKIVAETIKLSREMEATQLELAKFKREAKEKADENNLSMERVEKDMEHELQNLQDKNERLEKQVSDLLTKLQLTNQENNELKRENQELKKEIEEHEKESEEVLKTLDEVNEKADELGQVIKEFKEQELESKLKDANLRLKVIIGESLKLKEKSQLSNAEKQEKINKLLTEHSQELEELDNLLDEERNAYHSIRDTLIKYLTQKYPTLQDQEQLTELNLEKINQAREEQGETELLEGGELDLTTFKNLEVIEIYRQFLKTSITKLNVSGITDLSTENNRKKGVIKEVLKLTELKGVKVNFSQPNSEEESKEADGNIFIEIDKKDQQVKDNLKEEYQKEFALLLNPSTFPTNQLEIQELLTIYYPNLAEIVDSQAKEITISPKIVDQTWSTIQHQVIELTDQELKNSPSEEQLKELAFQLKVDYSSSQSSILLTYHSQSPLIKELQELFTNTPLKLENELLKQEKEQLPTPENFEKLQTQNRLLDNSLQDLTDAETYQKIKTKVVLEFLGDDQVEGDDTSIPFIENQTEKYQKTWQEAIDFICSIYEHRLIFRVITDEPMKFKYINKKLDKEQKTIISEGSLRLLAGVKLTGDLIIQDYPILTEIDLKNHELTSLKITNCPNLKEINVRNNQLTKLEISGDNKIEQIIAGQNELNELNLTNCPNLKELIMPDNPYLVEIKGLNLSTIKNLNLNNTSVNLAQDYEELKAEKERLLGAIETLKEGGEEGKLMLTEAIESSEQVEENIQRHLQKTEQE
ncbi:17295_t:CDS:2 [Funneliformis geosporum]|nr:17295_t:CDS:2 [Funneliformis geosporum]